MGRLKELPVLVTGAPQRIARTVEVEQVSPVSRDEAPWRSWYKTGRWQALRQQVLLRDSLICQRTGVVCVGKYPAQNSPTVNHKVPHRGDPRLFWDINNLETVTKAVHDSMIQREEQEALKRRGVWD